MSPPVAGNPTPPLPSPTPRPTTERLSSLTAAPAATPTPSTPSHSVASPQPAQQTAFKLAKQLRKFQGCTHEQHEEADQLHQQYHQRADVHSKCSSLPEVTTILRGNHRTTPLPNVLSSPKLVQPRNLAGVDCKAAFEGTSAFVTPEDIGTRDEHLPRNLCLSKYYTRSRKNRLPSISFDIDSTCCFPISLGIASQGMNWFPKVHPFLNLHADIHFSLKVPWINATGVLTERYTPLHQIPHYCFGSLIGLESLLLFVFFPALHLCSQHEHSTFLSTEDQELWYDSILAPAIFQTMPSSNILQHLPTTYRVVNIESTALSAEGLARKESSRAQLLKYALQPQYLDSLWNLILATIADTPRFSRFAGATLFMHSKNTKLESMNTAGDLCEAYDRWFSLWSQATDARFYNQDRTFIDLAKQTTSEDSTHLESQALETHEAEVYLWKKCCLDAYSQTRTTLNPDGSRAKGNPKRTQYPWATLRDTMGQTLFAVPEGQESQDGLIYSQFYGLIKTPFDVSKVYVLDNDSLENLALDPAYVRSLQQEGSGVTFSKGVCEFAYLHGKRRAYANLIDNQWKSYGVREEHRISLTLLGEIYQQWRQWDLYDDDSSFTTTILPYYIVPTQDLLGFLYAQVNKFCFLFEHLLASTTRTYSLPETILMVTALRGLRFSYSSSLLARELLLYKDRWETPRGQKVVIKEGLGY